MKDYLMDWMEFDYSFSKEIINKTLNLFYSEKKEDCNEFIIDELLTMLI